MLASFLCLDFPNIKPLLLHESRNSVRSMAYQMEGYCIRNPALLTRELETIHELTKGLEYQLDEPCPAKLKPTVQDILTCLDRCRAMVRSNGKQHAEPVQEIKSHVANTVASSPHAITNTPWSRGDGQNFRDTPKKRKIQTTHVQVCMHENFEGVPEDDYSWRKYGQKGILGTKSPRAYYRCRHRETQGCMAKKQVQRSEENPSIYNITYRGIHTCVEVPRPIQMPATIPEKQDPPQENMNSLSHQNSSDSQMHMNFTNSPTVQTENLNRQDFGTVSSFPCTPIIYERAQDFHSSTSEDYHMSGMFSPFNSLMTSDFNLLPWPAPQIGIPRGATQSDLSELIPAATSTTSPPFVNSDFAWEWTNF